MAIMMTRSVRRIDLDEWAIRIDAPFNLLTYATRTNGMPAYIIGSTKKSAREPLERIQPGLMEQMKDDFKDLIKTLPVQGSISLVINCSISFGDHKSGRPKYVANTQKLADALGAVGVSADLPLLFFSTPVDNITWADFERAPEGGFTMTQIGDKTRKQLNEQAQLRLLREKSIFCKLHAHMCQGNTTTSRVPGCQVPDDGEYRAVKLFRGKV
jgi:hypothetical protein